MTTLVTFDVDGTLITNAGLHSNKLHKKAFAHAWTKVFGKELDIEYIRHTGMTDPLILLKVLEVAGIPKTESTPKLKEMEHEMVQYWNDHNKHAGDGLMLLPGVVELFKALQVYDHVYTGLVTGNLEPIGWSKMEALGILGLFSNPYFGGFGSDFCSGDTVDTWKDRGELVRIAARRCDELHERPSVTYHIGDTPMDLLAAQAAGAKAIGVLTGTHTREELEAAGVADVVILKDLSNTAEVVAALGLAPTAT